MREASPSRAYRRVALYTIFGGIGVGGMAWLWRDRLKSIASSVGAIAGGVSAFHSLAEEISNLTAGDEDLALRSPSGAGDGPTPGTESSSGRFIQSSAFHMPPRLAALVNVLSSHEAQALLSTTTDTVADSLLRMFSDPSRARRLLNSLFSSEGGGTLAPALLRGILDNERILKAVVEVASAATRAAVFSYREAYVGVNHYNDLFAALSEREHRRSITLLTKVFVREAISCYLGTSAQMEGYRDRKQAGWTGAADGSISTRGEEGSINGSQRSNILPRGPPNVIGSFFEVLGAPENRKLARELATASASGVVQGLFSPSTNSGLETGEGFTILRFLPYHAWWAIAFRALVALLYAVALFLGVRELLLIVAEPVQSWRPS